MRVRVRMSAPSNVRLGRVWVERKRERNRKRKILPTCCQSQEEVEVKGEEEGEEAGEEGKEVEEEGEEAEEVEEESGRRRWQKRGRCCQSY